MLTHQSTQTCPVPPLSTKPECSDVAVIKSSEIPALSEERTSVQDSVRLGRVSVLYFPNILEVIHMLMLVLFTQKYQYEAEKMIYI